MVSQLHGNNYWHSHDQACFQVERSDFSPNGEDRNITNVTAGASL